MPDLNFTVQSAEPLSFAAMPTLSFKIRVENATPNEVIHTIALRAQIQIEATRRRYDDQEKQRLRDLFDEPDRWSRTLRSMLWTHASTVIPSFTAVTTAELQIPCTFDFNVAATKFFHGVSEGEVPLNLMFSGTVFYASGESALQVAPISWDKEARFRLPVQTWKMMMDEYYPNTAWLALRRDVFERLYEYKVRNGIQTWEEALNRMLQASEEAAEEPVRQ
jgi:hypothetical protein